MQDEPMFIVSFSRLEDVPGLGLPAGGPQGQHGAAAAAAH